MKLKPIILLLFATVSNVFAADTLPDVCEPSDNSSQQDVWECLNLIIEKDSSLWEARRTCAIDVIFKQFGSIYGYSGLMRDSFDTDYELDTCYNFEPYEYKLGPEIDALIDELRSEPSIAVFNAKVDGLISCMNDGHTVFVTHTKYITTHPPIDVDVSLDLEGKQQFTVSNNNKISSYDEYAGTKIKTINGLSPIDYFLELVKCDGTHKDEGVRLNKYITGSSGNQVRRTLKLPQEGKFNAVLDDGSQTHIDDRWYFDTSKVFSTSLVEMLSHFLPQDQNAAKYYMDLLHKHDIGPDICPPALYDTNYAQRDLSLVEENHVKPQDNQERDLEQQVLHFPFYCNNFDIENFDENTLGKIGQRYSYHMSDVDGSPVIYPICEQSTTPKTESSLVVLMLFIPDYDKKVTIFKYDGFEGIFYKGLKVAAEFANAYTNGELIIDFINNGGGSISEGYAFNYYLYGGNPNAPSFAKPVDACEYYDMPKTFPLDYLVDAALTPPMDLETLEDPKQWLLNYSQILKKTHSELHVAFANLVEDFPSIWICIDQLIYAFSSSSEQFPVKEDSGIFSALQNAYVVCYNKGNSLYKQMKTSGNLSYGGYGLSNIKPKGTNNFLSITNAENVLLEYSWDYYNDAVERRFGGEKRKFSSKAFLASACYWYKSPNSNALIPIEGGVKSIKYLTDGSCGSTCSVTTTRPYVEGLSTTITFGGIAYQNSDITSFNGGNVYNTGEKNELWWLFFKDLVNSFPHTQKWPMPEEIVLPLPVKGDITFAQRAQYPKAMGDNARPREFYKIPSSYHINQWTTKELTVKNMMDSTTLKTLVKLYVESAMKEDKPMQKCAGPEYSIFETAYSKYVKYPIINITAPSSKKSKKKKSSKHEKSKKRIRG